MNISRRCANHLFKSYLLFTLLLIASRVRDFFSAGILTVVDGENSFVALMMLRFAGLVLFFDPDALPGLPDDLKKLFGLFFFAEPGSAKGDLGITVLCLFTMGLGRGLDFDKGRSRFGNAGPRGSGRRTTPSSSSSEELSASDVHRGTTALDLEFASSHDEIEADFNDEARLRAASGGTFSP